MTTLSESQMSGGEILELYRLRWQIEIYFKRLKGLCRLGRMRSKRGSAPAEADIFGRLLLVAESGKRLRANWNGLTGERTATNYGIWKAMLEELREAVPETRNWREDEWHRKLKILRGRKRKRKLQRLRGKVLNKLKLPAPRAFAAKAGQMIYLPA